jgi:hypothetical protein
MIKAKSEFFEIKLSFLWVYFDYLQQHFYSRITALTIYAKKHKLNIKNNN